ncbi:hypothetical protein GCM10027517_02590 [Phycicoccus ginsengisoli]
MHVFVSTDGLVQDETVRDGSSRQSWVRGLRGRRGASLDDRGATAVEYAIMVSLIAVVIVSAVALFGQNMVQLFGVPSSAL